MSTLRRFGLALVLAAPALATASAAERGVELRFDDHASRAASQQVLKAAEQPSLVVTRVLLSDNADDDGWADTRETVTMSVEVHNLGRSLTGVTLRLTSDDPSVACITRSVIHLGDLPSGATVIGAEAFEWIVASGVERADPFQDLAARFAVHPSAVGFQDVQPLALIVDLDLDSSGGGVPTTWFESFETGFGAFTTMHIDEGLNPPDNDLGNLAAGVINADGARCQYSDPDWEESTSFGNGAGLQCFPNPNGAADRFWFRVNSERAFSGMQSLSWNHFLDPSLGYTTPTAQLEAVRTTLPVNLGYDRVCSTTRGTVCETEIDCPVGETCDFASPTLTLKHQISLTDHRTEPNALDRSLDRGIVAVQLADAAGDPAGDWIKAYPFVNVYDTQAGSNYFACFFDPTDDGNDEGDFFDPTDPNRRHGPSSTCAPEFNFVHQGDTDGLFDAAETGDASGPGLQGSHGIGTWVEPAFDLSRFRGRRLRVRLLMAGRKLGSFLTWQSAFQHNPNPGDDGWFVDDVQITDALVEPATLSADSNDNLDLPVCEDFYCGQAGGVDVSVTVTPAGPTAEPGRLVEIDASASSVDVCLDGALEYRFWVDVDADSAFNPGLDVLLRDWSYDPRLSDAPAGETRYGVGARCETAPDCGASMALDVAVECPGAGDGVAEHANAFLHDAPANRRAIRLDGQHVPGGKDVILYWSTGAIVDVVRGNLVTLRSTGIFGFNETCVVDNQSEGTSLLDTTPTAQPGRALFWLARSAEECNDPGAGGSYGAVGESSTRDSITACPD